MRATKVTEWQIHLKICKEGPLSHEYRNLEFQDTDNDKIGYSKMAKKNFKTNVSIWCIITHMKNLSKDFKNLWLSLKEKKVNNSER